MSTVTEAPRQMGRKRKPEGSEPPTVAVKIDRALAGKARMIATDKGLSLAEFISEAIRGVVDKEWAKLVRKMEGGS